MKTKTILSFMVAIVIALFSMNVILASTSTWSAVDSSSLSVSINDVDVTSGAILSGYPSETVPVVVTFKALENATDLKVKISLEGYKSDIAASSPRFDVFEGKTRIQRLSLTLPSVEDLDSNPEEPILHVEITDKDNTFEVDYKISVQQDEYSLDLIQADVPLRANAGEVVAIDVVVKNNGGRDSEDTFVVVSIPELGISKRTYFGDVYSTEDDQEDTDNEDARERRVYLTIPSDAISGDYTVKITASNYDVSATANKVITITGTAASNSTNVITPGSNNAKAGIPTSVIVLTVVLVIIFVVLLIVLIVLLTKKPSEKTEDFGETSYY